MPSLLDTLVDAFAPLSPRPAFAGTPHESPASASILIFVTLSLVAGLLLTATLAAL